MRPPFLLAAPPVALTAQAEGIDCAEVGDAGVAGSQPLSLAADHLSAPRAGHQPWIPSRSACAEQPAYASARIPLVPAQPLTPCLLFRVAVLSDDELSHRAPELAVCTVSLPEHLDVPTQGLRRGTPSTSSIRLMRDQNGALQESSRLLRWLCCFLPRRTGEIVEPLFRRDSA